MESNIWKYYIFSFLTGLMFFTPIIVLFWQENGLSLFQIMLLQSIFALTVVLFEIPSGFFADVKGRKLSLILAGVFLTLGGIVYSISGSFFGFVIAEVAWAVGLSFASGTDVAFVYDSLAELKKEHTFKKVQGTAYSINLISSAIGAVIGGFLGHYSLRLPFYALIPPLFLTIVVALTFKEPPRTKNVYEKGYLHTLYKIGRFALYKNKEVRWLIFYFALLGAFDSISLWFYQPYFKLGGLKVVYFGIVFAAFNIIAALSSKYAHYLEERIGKRTSLIILGLISGLTLMIMSKVIFLFSFVFVFLLQFVRGFSRPVIDDYINKIVWSDKRATVISIKSFFRRLVFAGFSPFIGWFADAYTLLQALMLCGIIVTASSIILIVLFKKDKII